MKMGNMYFDTYYDGSWGLFASFSHWGMIRIDNWDN